MKTLIRETHVVNLKEGTSFYEWLFSDGTIFISKKKYDFDLSLNDNLIQE